METNTVAIAITISVTTFFRILFELIFYQNRVILLPQPAGQRLRRLPVSTARVPYFRRTRAMGCVSRVRRGAFHACGRSRFTRAAGGVSRVPSNTGYDPFSANPLFKADGDRIFHSVSEQHDAIP